MSFADQEVSPDRGEPIRLYLFRYGEPAGAVVAYTDADKPRDFDNGATGTITYQPIAIESDEITASGTTDRPSIDIRTPDDVELADLFHLYPPSRVVTVTIYEGHANDPDEQFLLEWTGRVLGFGVDGDHVARFTCEPIGTNLKWAGLRRNWQYGCPYVLYGSQCKANKEAATETHVVLAVSGSVLTLAENWSDRRDKFVGGMVEYTRDSGIKEVRTIISCEDDGTVTLGGIAIDLEAGESVDFILGCNHKMGVGPQPDGDCKPLHNNIQNFGGQAWIPTKNPVGLVNQYY